MMARYDAVNPQALSRLVADGVNLVPFPEDMMETALRVSEDLMEEQAAANPAYRRIHQEWKQWRGDSYRWFGVADQAYESFALPRLETGRV
jgi:TRAP-type mannitol/chloroaromatic compound transport system substrate-binding protein